MSSGDIFGTTPPQPRSRKKRTDFKNNAYAVTMSTEMERGRCAHRNNIPTVFDKKKQTEARSNQRDWKIDNLDVFSNEIDDVVATLPSSKGPMERKKGLSSVSDNVMTVQYPHNLRCLKSQVSSEDLLSLEKSLKSEKKQMKPKPVKKRTTAAPKLKRNNRSFSKRISYMRMVDKLLKGNTLKRAENAQHSQMTDQQYHSHWNELIWLELQAWHSGETVLDTDRRLYSARRAIIPELLQFIVKFEFNLESIEQLDVMVKEFQYILKEIAELGCDDCGIYSDEAIKSTSSDTNSIELLIKQQVGNWTDKTQGLLSPDNLKNNDISLSFVPTKSYLDLQDIAIHKVGVILKELCNIENMFPSTLALSKDYPYYLSSALQEKVSLLCGWFNITVDLRIKFRHIVRKFMNIKDHINDKNNENCECVYASSHLQLSDEFNSNYRLLFGIDIKSLDDDVLRNGIDHLATQMLRQNSVTKLMEIYLTNHLASMVKVRKHILPSKTQLAFFEIGDQSSDYVGEKSLDSEYKKMISHISEVLPNLDLSVINIQASFESEVHTISSSTEKTAVFGLPSLIPLYSFLPHGLLNLMKSCIDLRLSQTNPELLNRGSSSSLLTARQFVTEYKEMLECGLLARDIYAFFIIDTHCYTFHENDGTAELYAFNENLSLMLDVYLQYTQLWLVGLLNDLPLAPRSFKGSLEQEWNFACRVSPKISFNAALLCSTKFTDICSAIVDSTTKFIVTAMDAIMDSHNEEYPSSEDQTPEISFKTPEIFVSQSRQVSKSSSSSSIMSTDSSEKKRLRAGVLWYHRQRSDSPHLSRKVSTSPLQTSISNGEISPLAYRQHSFTSQDSSSSLRLTPNPVETQRRYYFELCRAVKELFNEVRERGMRILSFAKQLRKKLEPAIGFDVVDITDVTYVSDTKALCSYCQLYEYFKKEGYVKLDIKSLSPEQLQESGLMQLDNFVIFLPTSQQVGDDQTEDDDIKSNMPVWEQIKNVIFSHLELSANEDNENMLKEKASWMIFLKKPAEEAVNRSKQKNQRSSSPRMNTRDMSGRRASSDVIFKKKKRQAKNSKCHSDGNLLSTQNEERKLCDSSSCMQWQGRTTLLDTSDIKNVKTFGAALQHFDFINDFTAVLASADDLSYLRKDLTKSLTTAAKLSVGQMSVVREVNESLNKMRESIIDLGNTLMDITSKAAAFLHQQTDDSQFVGYDSNIVAEAQQQVKTEINEVMQSCFNFGFDFIKEGSRIMAGDFRVEMDKLHIYFAKQWMHYVKKYRNKGNGHMPRWAGQGLKFVVSVEWSYIKGLTDEEFTEFQALIDSFIDHVISDIPLNKSGKTEIDKNKLSAFPSDQTILRSLSNTSVSMLKDVADHPQFRPTSPSFTIDSDEEYEYYETPIERVRIAVEELDELIDVKKQEDRVIGKVTSSPRPIPVVNLGVRTVNFQWQRGTKVGEGSFGRVYTCVNVDTGVILAMKEIRFQGNDHQKIRSILDEITNFEGIQHRNLVQNYGVELHHQEMYIFMEYCDGGTLEQICKLGLPETMIRRYTAQILSALSVLHANGILHRDIKGSNIFLTSSGQAKLGDFGSALKLKNKHKTLPGEISTHIGTTTAYTAPEVINGSNGYGRSADIWSVGCVVVEMASGKRPWHDLEPVQIMFKVGMECAPAIPDNLSPEGKDFLSRCLNPKPTKRWSCDKLMGHPFVKVINLE